MPVGKFALREGAYASRPLPTLAPGKFASYLTEKYLVMERLVV